MKITVKHALERLECARGDYIIFMKKNGKFLYTRLVTIDSRNAKLIDIETGNRVSDHVINPLDFKEDIKVVSREIDSRGYQVVRKEDVEVIFNNVKK